MEKSTNTTSRIKEANRTFSIGDWFKAHRTAQWRNWYNQKNQDIRPFLDFTWPLSIEYWSDVLPIFVTGNYDPNLLKSNPTWLVRDGLVPLIWFFNTVQKPEDLKTRLLIHEDLLIHVPPHWQKHVGSYRLISNPNRKLSKPKRVLISGMSLESLGRISQVRQRLEAANSLLKLRDLPKNLLIFSRFEASQTEGEGVTFIQRYFETIYREIGFENNQHISWTSFESTPELDGTAYLDLFGNLLCADRYIDHLALQKGAEHIFRPTLNAHGKYIPVSSAHGFWIRERIPAKEFESAGKNPRLKEALVAEIAESMRSPANQGFAWPQWLQTLANHAIENPQRWQ